MVTPIKNSLPTISHDKYGDMRWQEHEDKMLLLVKLRSNQTAFTVATTKLVPAGGWTDSGIKHPVHLDDVNCANSHEFLIHLTRAFGPQRIWEALKVVIRETKQ